MSVFEITYSFRLAFSIDIFYSCVAALDGFSHFALSRLGRGLLNILEQGCEVDKRS